MKKQKKFKTLDQSISIKSEDLSKLVGAGANIPVDSCSLTNPVQQKHPAEKPTQTQPRGRGRPQTPRPIIYG